MSNRPDSQVRAARGVVVASTLVLAMLTAVSPPAWATSAAGGPRVLLRIRDGHITESSALAVSTRFPHTYYTLDDSGGGPDLFALDGDGRTRAVLHLNVDNRDWEALTPGPDHTLWVGDTGDNDAVRTRGILVHRVHEPSTLRTRTLPAARVTSYRLRYSDGPHDAETVLVDPGSGRLYVVTKSLLGGGIYAAPNPLRPRSDGPNLLRRVASAPPIITDGSFSPDGSHLFLRNYSDAFVYSGVGGSQLSRIHLPEQPQGESLAVARNGRALLVGSEGRRSEVWKVPLASNLWPPLGSNPTTSAATSRTASAAAPPGGSHAPSPTTSGPRPALLVAGAVALAALVVAGLLASQRRQR